MTFKTNCTHSNDYMTVNYFDDEFGFDIFDEEDGNEGILVSRNEAKKLIKFLQERLDKDV